MASKRRSSEIIQASTLAAIGNGGGGSSSHHRRSNSWTLCTSDDEDEFERSLAERLTNQRWHEVGNGPYPMCATAEFDVMVDQLSSILAMRLRDLLVFRMQPRLRGVAGVQAGEHQQRGGGDYVGRMHNDDNSSSPGGDKIKAMANSHCFLKLDSTLGDYVLGDSITESIRDYVTCIGRLYNHVGFHSFEHATHVTVSMNKLLYMATANNHFMDEDEKILKRQGRSERHGLGGGSSYGHHHERTDFSFGIGEDPRILFAMVFSALIHDVGHTGVPNSVLVDEEDDLAILHNDVSVSEQNSLQVAFSMLQKEEFSQLKRCICPTPEERKFFRKKVICMVMVTDISDQERIQIVASRWNAAFPKCNPEGANNGGGGNASKGRNGEQADMQSIQSIDERGGGESEGEDPNTQRPIVQRHPPPQQQQQRGRRTSNSRREIQSPELRASLRRRRFTMFSTDAAAEEFANERHNRGRRLGIRTSMDFSGMLLDAYGSTDQLQQHAVLETMMNVADVAHTMQSFGVFCKWNRRLYKEFYAARLKGRLTFDPEENWYENQIGFFSHYIIPLSRKMKTCGVFGTTGTVFEYFATENKKRWIEDGEEISEEIIREVKKEVEREQRMANEVLSNGCHSCGMALY